MQHLPYEVDAVRMSYPKMGKVSNWRKSGVLRGIAWILVLVFWLAARVSTQLYHIAGRVMARKATANRTMEKMEKCSLLSPDAHKGRPYMLKASPLPPRVVYGGGWGQSRCRDAPCGRPGWGRAALNYCAHIYTSITLSTKSSANTIPNTRWPAA